QSSRDEPGLGCLGSSMLGRAYGFSSANSAMAPVEVGDSIPSVVVLGGEARNKLNLAELFRGMKGVLFGIPEAFTPEYKVRLLSDPTGAFGKEMDLLLDNSLVSVFGKDQLKRFSMVEEDDIVKSLHVEPDGIGCTCSLAPNIVLQL
uniref:Uncharacterized protein n=1 Tax=Panthera tigris altaica TaxID=74533 RepID=A0A8C9JTL3_PANTA